MPTALFSLSPATAAPTPPGVTGRRRHSRGDGLAALALAAVLLSTVALACQEGGRVTPTESASQQPAPSAAASPHEQHYGTPPTAGANISVDELLAEPGKFADQAVLVEGHVRRACEKRGCWMEMAASADPGAPGCRITFKDYGFFVPTDSAGSKARVQGTVQTKTLEAGEVRHLESDGARFANKDAAGRVQEVRLVASGVTLVR